MSAKDALEAELGEAEAEPAEEDREPLYPFYRVRGDSLEGATIQAGWVTETGEVDFLVMDMTDVGVNLVEQAFALAFGWYCEQLNIIARQRAAAAEVDGEEAAVEDTP